jgi:hypothetical protein
MLIYVASATTSGAVALFYLSKIAEIIEAKWSRRHFVISPLKWTFPGEQLIEAWLKYSHVRFTAKQWMGSIIGFVAIFALFGAIMPNIGLVSDISGLAMSISVIMFPFSKRKKFNMDMELQIQRMKRMLAKLYARGVRVDEMLPIVADAMEEGQFKRLLEQTILRTKTTDTIGQAIQWLSDEIQLPSLQALASIMVQGAQYADLPLDERLLQMAKKDREKALINYEKLAESKRTLAMVEAGGLIALPLIVLVAAFVFYYVFGMFSAIQF